MKIGVASSLTLVVALMACAEVPYLPDGDPTAGKVVFAEQKCFSCHEVIGDDYPDPSAIPPTFVALGSPDKENSRSLLAESIIAPSHQFAQPQPPSGQSAGDENVRDALHSRMLDFSESLTVRQLLDLVAYLEHLQRGER